MLPVGYCFSNAGYSRGVEIGAILHGLLEFAFPWRCAVCNAGFEGTGPLCSTCAEQLRDLEAEPHCPACAAPLPMQGNPCPYCRGKGPTNFERVVRLCA